MAEIGTDIFKAKKLLEERKLVAIPTETVYGLGGNAFSDEAVTQIFKVKNRPEFDPLITHTDHIDKIKKYVTHMPEQAELLAHACWPGPLTLLLPKTSKIPDIVTSGLESVAVRIPNHELTLSLLRELEFPVAAPSANPFGYISPTSAKHVADQLGDKIPYILDGGPCTVGIESTIVGFDDKIPTVYRLGGMSLEEIENIVGKVKLMAVSNSNPKAPGMMISHYAPAKPFIIGKLDELINQYDHEKIGILSFQDTYTKVDNEKQIALSESGNVTEAAKNLFASMRYLDSLNVDLILAELVPDHGLGRAVNDRLRRAAAKL